MLSIDREQLPAVFTVGVAVTLPLAALAVTYGSPWRAHLYVPTALTNPTPAHLAQHNGTRWEPGNAAVLLWNLNPALVWPFVLLVMAYVVWALRMRSNYVGEESYTNLTLGDSPGAFIANTEFWVATGAQHAALAAFALSPASPNFIALETLLLMLGLAALCEPNDDHGAQSARAELTTNRLALAVLPGVAALTTAAVNSREVADDASGFTLFVQIFLDLILLMAHAQGAADFGKVLRARSAFLVASGVAVVFWLHANA